MPQFPFPRAAPRFNKPASVLACRIKTSIEEKKGEYVTVLKPEVTGQEETTVQGFLSRNAKNCQDTIK